jgi:hypothetical protein
MKQLFSIITAVALLATVSQAEQYNSVQMGAYLTNAATATTVHNTGTVPCTKENDVAIFWKCTSAGTNLEPVTLTIMPSCDGSTWDTNFIAKLTLTTTANAATYCSTNITLGAIGYIRVGTIANTGTNIIVSVVKAYKKPIRQGN